MARSIDEQIARLAIHGNITREQLLGLGLGPAAIAYRARTGRLHRAHVGVYGIGRPPTTALERAAAAVLACGRDAALSHRSALTLWGFDSSRWQFPLHVSSPHCRRRPGIITHRVPSLQKKDLRAHVGIRVTSPARTVLDCASGLSDKRLARVAADGRRAGQLHAAAIADVLERFPNHPGHRLLAAVFDAAQPTRSEFEDAFLRFSAAYNLPPPLVNTYVCGYEVDVLFPEHRLIVELDSWAFHQDRHNFEGDRNRDADTLVAGYATVRITWERLTGAPAKEAQRLERILLSRETGRPPRT